MAQVGRISGGLLQNNLLRLGATTGANQNLTFRNVSAASGGAAILHLDVINGKIGINNDAPSTELHVLGTTRIFDPNASGTNGFLTAESNINIADLNIQNSTIQPLGGTNNIIFDSAGVITSTNVKTEELYIDDNYIESINSNSNIELQPNGTGSTEIFSNLNVRGDLHSFSDITADGNIVFGDNLPSDTVIIKAEINSDVIPDVDNVYTLGNTSKRWIQIESVLLNGQETTGDDALISGVNINMRQGKIWFVAKNGSNSNVGDHPQGPFETIDYAVTQASTGDTIYVFPGVYEESCPITIPQGVTLHGHDQRNTIIEPASSQSTTDIFLLNGETALTNFTIRNFYYDNVNDVGYAFRFAPGGKVTSRSPYIQNVTVSTKGSTVTAGDPLGFIAGDAGRGILADGAVLAADTREASLLFHAITLIVPNADALVMTNGVRIEWLNSFTYYANRGFYATNGSGRVDDNLQTHYGAEVRSIGSANIYGNYGAVADGADTLMYLIMHNFGYVGTGSDSSNDDTLTIQANEVVETNNGRIQYQSQSHSGDFRVGDNFLIDFEKGSQTFNINDVPVVGVDTITVTTGSDVSYLDLQYIQTGNLRLIGNSLASISGDMNIDSASGLINLNGNVNIDQNLDVSGDITIGGTLIRFGNNQNLDVITFESGIDSNLTPKTTDTYNIGSSSLRWDDVWLTQVLNDNINATNNFIETTESNSNLELRASGTGQILISDSVTLGGNLTVTTGSTEFAGITDVNDNLTLTNFSQVGDLSITGNVSLTESLTVNGSSQFEDILFSGNVVTTTLTNSDLELRASGTGNLLIPNNNVSITNKLTVSNTFTTGDLTSVSNISAEVFTNNDLTILDNNITAITGNLELSATGNVVFDNAVQIDNNLTVTTDLTTINNNLSVTGLLDHTGNRTQIGNYSQTGNLDVSGIVNLNSQVQLEEILIDDNFITTTSTNANLELRASGTGVVRLETTDIQTNLTATGVDANSLTATTINSATLNTATITIAGNKILSNVGDLILEGFGPNAADASSISVQFNDFIAEQNLSVVALTTNLQALDITGSLTQTGNRSQVGDYNLTGNLLVDGDIDITKSAQFEEILIDDNFITTTSSNADLELRASGTGQIIVPNNNVTITNNLDVNNSITLNQVQNTTSINTEIFRTDELDISDNTITTTQSNADLTLRANGTGEVYVPSNDVEITNNLTVNGITDLQTTNINGTLTHTGDKTQGSTITVPVTFNNIINRPAGLDTNYLSDYAFENMDKDNTGQYAIVGISGADSPYLSGGNWGVVHIIEISTGNVVQTIENPLNFNGTDAENRDAFFGQGLAIHGDIAVISAPQQNVLDAQGTIVTANSGVVHIFNWVTNTYLHTIEPVTPSANLQFGIDVAFDGNVIAIGTGNPLGVEQWLWGGVGNPSATSRGGTYSVPSAQYPIDGLRFSDLGVFDNHLFIGYRGGFSIHTALTRQTLATHTDANIRPQFHPFQRLRTDVYNGTLVIGAYNLSSSQTLYIVDLPNQTWTTLSSPAGTDSWSEGVAINQDYIIVGDPSDPQATVSGEGRVYVYDRDTLTLESIIDSSDNLTNVATNRAALGQNIILSKTTNDAIISASYYTVGSNTREGVALSYTFGATTISPATVQITGDMTVSGLLDVPNIDFENIDFDENVITTVDSNSDLELRAAGTGKVIVPSNDVEFTQNVNILGNTSAAIINSATTVTADLFNNNNYLNIYDNNILATTIQDPNTDIVLSATGNIVSNADNNEFNQNLDVDGTTTLADTNVNGSLTYIGDLTQTGNVTVNGNVAFNGKLTVDRQVQFENVALDDNIITTVDSNSDLELRAVGTGKVVISSSNILAENNFTVQGLTTTNGIDNGINITSYSFETDTGLEIRDNIITHTVTNSNISLDGTEVQFNSVTELNQNLTVDVQTNFTNTDIGVVGDENTTILNHTGNRNITGDFNIPTYNFSLSGQTSVTGTGRFGDIKLEQNVIRQTAIPNGNLELRASGTGKVLVPNNNVEITNNLSVSGTITSSDIVNASDINTDLLEVQSLRIYDNNVDAVGTNKDIVLETSGTGTVLIDTNDAEFGQDLTATNYTLGAMSVNGTITHVGDRIDNGILFLSGASSELNVIGTLDAGPTTQTLGNLRFGTIGPAEGIQAQSGSDIILRSTNNIVFDGDLSFSYNNISAQTITSNNINNTLAINSNAFETSDITITQDKIESVSTGTDLIIQPTGKLHVPSNNVFINQDLNVTGTTTVQDLEVKYGTVDPKQINHVGDRTVNDFTTTGNLIVTGNIVAAEVQFEEININDNTITTTSSNAYLELRANGTGEVQFDANSKIAQNLYLNGVSDITQLTAQYVQTDKFETNDIEIYDNRIQTTNTDSDLELSGAGTGSVDVEDISFNTNTISSTQSITFEVDGNIDVSDAPATKLPSGTTAQKTVNTRGDIRFNTQTGLFEGFTTVPVAFSGIYSADRLTSVDATKTSNQIVFTQQGVQTASIQPDNFFISGIELPQMSINNSTIGVSQTNTDLTFENGTGVFNIEDITIEDSKIINNTNNALEIKNNSSGYYTVLVSNTGVLIPSGPSADRTSVEIGDTRWNTDNQILETFDGNTYIASAGLSNNITPAEFDDLLFEYTLIFG